MSSLRIMFRLCHRCWESHSNQFVVRSVKRQWPSLVSKSTFVALGVAWLAGPVSIIEAASTKTDWSLTGSREASSPGTAPLTLARVDSGFRYRDILIADSNPLASDVIERAKAAEVEAIDMDDDRRLWKFLEFVVLPLSVCFALIMLLRRGVLR